MANVKMAINKTNKFHLLKEIIDKHFLFAFAFAFAFASLFDYF